MYPRRAEKKLWPSSVLTGASLVTAKFRNYRRPRVEDKPSATIREAPCRVRRTCPHSTGPGAHRHEAIHSGRWTTSYGCTVLQAQWPMSDEFAKNDPARMQARSP
jgi:hypothetical protein